MSVLVRKICQICGFLLLANMFFCIISVSSYTPADPTWNLYISKTVLPVQNLGGVVGASFAELVLLLFGGTIVLLVALGGVVAWYLMWGRLAAVANVAWRGGILFLAAGILAAIFYGDTRILWGKFFAGGVGGDWLATVLVTYLNKTGTYLAVATTVGLVFFVGGEHPFLRKAGHSVVLLGHSMRDSRRQVRRWGGILQGMMIGWYHMPRRVGARLCGGVQGLLQKLPWNEEFEVEEARESAPAMVQSPAVIVVPPGQDSGVTKPAPSIVAQPDQAEVTAPAPMAPAASRQDSEVMQAVRSVPSQPDHPGVTSVERTTYALEEARAMPPVQPRRDPRDIVPRQESLNVSVVPSRPAEPLVFPQRGMGITVPSVELLDRAAAPQCDQDFEDLEMQARFLEQKLREFGVEGEVVQVLPGPVITMYEFAPAAGVKVGKIVNLQDDLALVMRAISVRVVAPIPGKAVVGIEIPNRTREAVLLRDLLDADEFRTASSKLSMTLGKDILGKPVVIDLALIPHLLVAGATGSGKSVGLNSLICSLLFHATPADVKLIMIDPKMLEFSVYEGIPHLLIPVVTDPKKAAVALRRVVEEMGRRYQLLAARGVRSIAQYNQAIAESQRGGRGDHPQAHHSLEESPFPAEKLPYLVVIIDELSDLMMVSSREVEDALMRIAQMARAAGIHLIVATQRPSVDVLTGVIKANFPARLSFQVTSKVDSRTILDTNGAEKLLGRGDMLFLAPGTSKPQRVHGAYVSEAEIGRLVTAWKDMAQPCYDESFLEPSGEQAEVDHDGYDEKYDEAVALVAKTGQASISMLQRRLRVGYNRAARMIEIMEQEGIVGPADGVKPRTVLLRNTYDDM